MTIYLTGCTHFDHRGIIKMCQRPFNSVDEMNEVLIENWNKTVKQHDTVYHLGDFGHRKCDTQSYLKRLKGKIIRIKGNHDRPDWGPDTLNVHHQPTRTKVVLFHYPIEEWDGYFGGSVHLHCHTHDKQFKTAERRGNVGVDSCDYRPISLDEAIERLKPSA